MSLLTPCAAPVIHTLPNTGLDVWLMTGIGGVVVAGGITAVIMAKTLKGKLTALALPVFAVAGLALGNPQPSLAAAGAPTVTTEVAIQSIYNGGTPATDTVNITTAPEFNNPENCGFMTYQWQVTADNSTFQNEGAVSRTFAPLVYRDCNGMNNARLLVTLTNSSGSVTSTSNLGWLCD